MSTRLYSAIPSSASLSPVWSAADDPARLLRGLDAAAVGATLGKAVLGLKVVRRTGLRFGAGRAVLRTLVREGLLACAFALLWYSGAAPLGAPLGAATYSAIVAPVLVTRGRAALYDLICGVRVIRVAERPIAAVVCLGLLCYPVVAVLVCLFGGPAVYLSPSGAMEPTLSPGDRVVASSWLGLTPKAAPGDVVIYKAPAAADPYPQGADRDWIGRVVATHGETVRIADGILHRDGAPVEEPYIAEPTWYTWPSQRDDRRDWAVPMAVEADAYMVPQGCAIILGDNRNNSNDSHRWGPLPMDRILYRCRLVISGSAPPRRL